MRPGYDGLAGMAKEHGVLFRNGSRGDELGAEPAINKNDPNYDSFDEQGEEDAIFSILDHHQAMAQKAGISLQGLQGGGHLFGAPPSQSSLETQQLPAKMPLADFKVKSVSIVAEYLSSEDIDDLKRSVVELHSSMLLYEFVRRAVTLGMERKARERELVSVALSELHGSRILSAAQVAKGFERLFELIDDLSLDIPNAKKFLSQFVARAVADEILPPSFLNDPLIQHIGAEVVENAKILLSIKHGLVRLEHVWGPTSRASVSELKHEIKMLLEEFTSSSDIDEACNLVKRLNVGHFHHEVVKRAVVISLDCREREQAMMSSLLAELSSREIISEKQMEIGFRRLFQALPDLELDAPGAAKILDVFLHQAVQDRCISQAAADSIRGQYPNGK
ncbi:Programmed cell death protein 4 [Hondaea fermentalgiana]|uniref:Programmed cell death protein 4 n=1 Tax=Hondaea fermentalgiana TaxID=2315210 RepID=A0A2R5GLU2_9STRA|nr:Programmed cell death protein 4 [Hondaea fermentalgiana]|eukprot:GBG31866.1 Programmed cell death protein 4 [Hondaea fermentalgiana]